MAGTKRKRATTRKTKKSTARKSRKATSKAKTRSKSRTLKKKYSYYDRANRGLPTKKTSTRRSNTASAQPKTTLNRSKNPVDVANSVLAIAKKQHYGPIVPYKEEEKKKRRWGQFKKAAKKVAKATGDIIDDTAKYMDKAGDFAEKIAPTVSAYAAANPELPYLSGFAVAVDTAAGIHRITHPAFIEDLDEAYKRGDPNRQGMKQLTDSKKYQKLMTDTSDEDLRMTVFKPETIDTIPVDDDDIPMMKDMPEFGELN